MDAVSDEGDGVGVIGVADSFNGLAIWNYHEQSKQDDVSTTISLDLRPRSDERKIPF